MILIISIIVSFCCKTNNSIDPKPVQGSTYYVDASNGNDNNPGTEALPWQTIQKGASTAVLGVAVCIYDCYFTVIPIGVSFCQTNSHIKTLFGIEKTYSTSSLFGCIGISNDCTPFRLLS